MTEHEFRQIVLGLQGAVEGAHMGHPDFRVSNRIFATLHHDRAFAMVKLTPDQQQEFIRAHPGVFGPESGAWGLAGCTRVRLAAVDEETLGEAATLAWQNLVNRTASLPSRRRSPRQGRTRRR